MAVCPHDERLTPASCVECMAEGIRPDAPKLTRDGWPFAAKLDGTCGGCTEGVREGERIVRMSDGAYRHVGPCERRTVRS